MPESRSPRAVILAASKRLEAAGVPDPVNDAALLLAQVTGRPALSLRMDRDAALTDSQLESFDALCAQREKRTPLQWLLGTQPFCGHLFEVGPEALIPRPETELLAELALSLRARFPAPRALDLCTGSGCIACALALAAPGLSVEACDVSESALALAQRNAARLGAEVSFYRGDLFTAVEGRQYGCIVSNPPYIPAGELAGLQAEVRLEPVLALDGGEDGLAFYRRIAAGAPSHLLPGGALLMEIGSGQGEAVAALLRDAGFGGVAIHPDLAGLDRMAEAWWERA